MVVEDLNEHRQKRRPLIEIGTFIGVPAPGRHFVDMAKLLPTRNVVMLGGDGGTGKSLLALQLALSCATALPAWIGIDVVNGPVIYLSAEDDRDEIHKRVEEIMDAEPDADLESARGMLFFWALAGEDATLAIEQRATGTVKATELYSQLDLLMADISPVLLILDNLADVFAGNENNRSAVKHFIGMLRRLAIKHDCCVVLLAHPSLTGRNSGSGESGSTAWNNSVRVRMYLHRVIDDDRHEPDEMVRVLEVMKANYGPKGNEIELRWERGRFVRAHQAKLFDGFHHLEQLQAALREGQWRCDHRSMEHWAGFLLADMMELDAGKGLAKLECKAAQKSVRNRLRDMLSVLEKNGSIKRVRRDDEHRHSKDFYDAPLA